jgi:hypothetical protein
VTTTCKQFKPLNIKLKFRILTAVMVMNSLENSKIMLEAYQTSSLIQIGFFTSSPNLVLLIHSQLDKSKALINPNKVKSCADYRTNFFLVVPFIFILKLFKISSSKGYETPNL